MFPTRVGSLSLAIITSFILILIKIVYWQFYTPASLRRQEIIQKYNINQILPNRGKIYYQDNSLLAGNQRIYSLSVYKPNTKQPIEEIIRIINQQIPNLLPQDKKRIDNLLKPGVKWIDFETTLTSQQYQKLSNIPGFEFKPHLKRYYPELSLSPDIFVGIDDYYRRSLQGRTGYFYSNQDALGLPILTHQSLYIEPQDGWNLNTSINRNLQYLLENEISKGLSKYTADSAVGIILKPQSGEILAIASIGINPVNFLLEPGSIFKPLVVAAALDSQSITTSYVCPHCDRPFTASGFSINNWDNSFHSGSSLQDIIKNSDNIGMSQIIYALGQKKFLNYFNQLGLNHKTGIDLPNEHISTVKSYWSDIDLATASFGQGFAATPIQIIQAFNVLANNGNLVHPHLGISLSNQQKSEVLKQDSSTKVFSEGSIKNINAILKYAVENGAISQLKPKNLEVCAKSGTAQVAVDGQYSDSSIMASYVGYSPCVNPKFTMLIILSNPKSSSWGSSTAAPIWFSLASKFDKLL